VCCFVLLNQYWEIDTVPGFCWEDRLNKSGMWALVTKTREEIVDLGGADVRGKLQGRGGQVGRRRQFKMSISSKARVRAHRPSIKGTKPLLPPGTSSRHLGSNFKQGFKEEVDVTQKSGQANRPFFLLSWVANTQLNQREWTKDGVHPMSHVGPTKLSWTVKPSLSQARPLNVQ